MFLWHRLILEIQRNLEETCQGASTSISLPGLWMGCPPRFGGNSLKTRDCLARYLPLKSWGTHQNSQASGGLYPLMDQTVERAQFCFLLTSLLVWVSSVVAWSFPSLSVTLLAYRRSNFLNSVHYVFVFRWEAVTASFISFLPNPSVPKTEAMILTFSIRFSHALNFLHLFALKMATIVDIFICQWRNRNYIFQASWILHLFLLNICHFTNNNFSTKQVLGRALEHGHSLSKHERCDHIQGGPLSLENSPTCLGVWHGKKLVWIPYCGIT